jgi:hypothetical protein
VRENRTLRLTRRGLETGRWSDTAPVLDPTFREGYGNGGIMRSPLSAITLLDLGVRVRFTCGPLVLRKVRHVMLFAVVTIACDCDKRTACQKPRAIFPLVSTHSPSI